MDFTNFIQANWAVLTTAFLGAFIIDYFANILSFENRFVSAVVTGLLLIVIIWGTLILIGDDVAMQPLMMAGALMFVVAARPYVAGVRGVSATSCIFPRSCPEGCWNTLSPNSGTIARM